MASELLLIVEDDEKRRRTLDAFLSPQYHLIFAESVEKAVKQVDSGRLFKIAIVDWRLPAEDNSLPEPGGGFRVMREISERCPQLPVIVTYSWDTRDTIEKRLSELKNLKVVRYMEKPLLLDELTSSIQQALAA